MNDVMIYGERPELLAIDLDGTMLRADGRLSARVRQALDEAVAAGIHVVPSTGRPEIVAADIIEATELDQYWVFGNGAVTRHLARDELIRGFWIEQSTTLAVMAGLRERLPKVRFAVEFASDLAYEPGFEDVVPNRPPIPPTDDLFAAVTGHDGPIQKILVFDTSIDLGVLYDQVAGVGEGRIFPTYSGLNFVELAAGQVTKATALKLLADDLGLDASQVSAVGDNYNDLDMLEWAGTGYAMGNAGDHIKSAANAVLPSNEQDGVAVLIERLLR